MSSYSFLSVFKKRQLVLLSFRVFESFVKMCPCLPKHTQKPWLFHFRTKKKKKKWGDPSWRTYSEAVWKGNNVRKNSNTHLRAEVCAENPSLGRTADFPLAGGKLACSHSVTPQFCFRLRLLLSFWNSSFFSSVFLFCVIICLLFCSIPLNSTRHLILSTSWMVSNAPNYIREHRSLPLPSTSYFNIANWNTQCWNCKTL